MNKKEKEEQSSKALERLKAWIQPNDMVYTYLKSVSSNGISRQIAIIIPIKHGEIIAKNISWEVSRALNFKLNKQGNAITIGGAGMDMGYAIVYALSDKLFRDRYLCMGSVCHSNDHTNDNDGSWKRETNIGRIHSDAGYALQHSWL